MKKNLLKQLPFLLIPIALFAQSPSISQHEVMETKVKSLEKNTTANLSNFANVGLSYGIPFGREFTIGFFNTATYTWTYYNLPLTGGETVDLPEGTYSVRVYEKYSTGSFTFYFNSLVKYGGSTADFDAAPLSGQVHLEITED